MDLVAPATRLALTCEGVDPLQDQTAMELAAIRQSLINLRTFPWLRAREEAGDLALHGLWFDVADGRLCVLDEASGGFTPLNDAPLG
jgi:carbonic anhydrase